MGLDLTKVFQNSELQKFGHTTESIINLAFKVNKKTGARVARAVMDNGTTLVKTVTTSGSIIMETIKLPEILSIDQRNAVIRDLAKNRMTQEQIAALLDISQSTVSNVLRKK